MVALEAFADRLLMSAQPPLTPVPAPLCQLCVQLVPTAGAWNRNHEVAPRVADDPLHLPLTTPRTTSCPRGPRLVVAPGRAAELIREQVVTLQLGERPRSLPLFASQDPGHRESGTRALIWQNPHILQELQILT
jgi:hypothetical protein